MRPPHYTGEDRKCRPIWIRRRRCFNEAPALHGGRRRAVCRIARAPVGASMRPPHYTGEDIGLMKALDVAAQALQ